MCHIGNENRRTLTYNIASIPGGKKADRNNQRFRIKATFRGNISIDSLYCLTLTLSVHVSLCLFSLLN